ncbi:MAG: helix-turn-helix transcriptional regulator [Tannerellaceae bacterium]|jgi:DNA-binding CsgD family transcriptional regulator|nr:helix-turn-helix transcriptional regulator [Tannerellaceae bacterium]
MSFRLSDMEFFTDPKGKVNIAKEGSPIQEYQISGATNIAFTTAFLEYIQECYTEAYRALSEIYQASRLNHLLFNFKIVSRFIRCNFGRYDLEKHDIDVSGNFHFEEVPCPLRGTGDCPLDGIVCKPKFNTSLSEREMEVLRLIVMGNTAEDIAGMLYRSIHTINNHRKNILVKTGERDIAGLVHYWYLNGLK